MHYFIGNFIRICNCSIFFSVLTVFYACISDQKTRLCAFTEGMVTGTSWVDDSV